MNKYVNIKPKSVPNNNNNNNNNYIFLEYYNHNVNLKIMKKKRKRKRTRWQKRNKRENMIDDTYISLSRGGGTENWNEI